MLRSVVCLTSAAVPSCLEGLRKATNIRWDSCSPVPDSKDDPLEYAADDVLVLYPSGTVIIIEFMSQQNHVY